MGSRKKIADFVKHPDDGADGADDADDCPSCAGDVFRVTGGGEGHTNWLWLAILIFGVLLVVYVLYQLQAGTSGLSTETGASPKAMKCVTDDNGNVHCDEHWSMKWYS